ncbi:putative replicase [Red clover carlavirus A]|nr:putative replicase [Red clover carlavirus A]
MLYSVLPSYIDNSFLCVGIKQQKIELLKGRDPKLSMLQVVNRYVSSLDKLRYGNEFTKSCSSTIPGLKRHCKGLSGNTLKGLVPKYQVEHAKNLFFHDELHYWSLRDLSTFLEVYQPETCLATIVYPPELLAKSKRSLYPWCYHYDVVGSDLFFYPDNVRSEGYVQPLTGGYLLETSKIKLLDGTVYCVDILCSKFAHHLIAITRGDAVVPKYRAFGPFDATGVASLDVMSNNDVGVCFPVSFEVVSKVYRYLRSLKKPDGQSAMAKLSQILPEPSGLEIKFLQDFSKLVMGTGMVTSMITPDRLSIFLGGWLRLLPASIASRFKVVRELALDEFISHLEPYVFRCKTVERKVSDETLSYLFDLPEIEYGCDIVSAMGKFDGHAESIIRSPHFAPYEGEIPLRVVRRNLLEVQPAELCNYLCSLYPQSRVDHCNREFALDDLKFFLKRVCETNRNGLNGLILNRFTVRKMMDEENLKTIFSKMCSRLKRLRQFTFGELGLSWFYSNSRFYSKFLCNEPDGLAIPLNLMSTWGKLVREVVSGTKLHKTNYRYLGIKHVRFASERVSSSDSQKQGDERKEEAIQACEFGGTVPMELVQALNCDELNRAQNSDLLTKCGSLLCACGIVMDVLTLNTGTMHGFKAVDQLRGRKAGWYSANGESYHYSGATHKSLGWPAWLKEWMDINGIDSSYYDCCLYQEYEAGKGIGFHRDDEEIFEDGASIATCNIIGEAEFKVSCKVGVGSEVLKTGTYFVMPEYFQKSHKHSVCNCTHRRASATFRKLKKGSEISHLGEDRDEIHVELGKDPQNGPPSLVNSTETEASVNKTEVELVTGALDSLPQYREVVGFSGAESLWLLLGKLVGYESDCLANSFNLDSKFFINSTATQNFADNFAVMGIDQDIVCKLLYMCTRFNVTIIVALPDCRQFLGLEHPLPKQIFHISIMGEDFSILEFLNFCVPKAIACAMGRSTHEVHAVIKNGCSEEVVEEMERSGTVSLDLMQDLFALFDIKAKINTKEGPLIMNQSGRIVGEFSLRDEHIEYLGKKHGFEKHSELRYCEPTFAPTQLSIDLLKLAGSSLRYEPSEERAMALVRSLNQGATGVLCSELFNGKKPIIEHWDDCFKVPREILGIFGTFGSGKSTLLSRVVKMNQGKNVWYVSPRKALAEDFKSKIGLSGGPRRKATVEARVGMERWRVVTFEILLLRIPNLPVNTLLILDEIQLYPPGYLDVLVACAPIETTLVVAGDPCQSDYDSEKDRNLLSHLGPDFLKLLGGTSYKFNSCSKRFKNPDLQGRLPCSMSTLNFDQGEIESFLLLDGVENLATVPEQYLNVILVSSFDEKKIVEFYNPKFKNVMTFGESTGLSFSRGGLLITDVSRATSEQRWVTALSRFSESVCMINASSDSMKALPRVYKGRCLAKFFSRSANRADLEEMLPGTVIFTDNYLDEVGKDEGLREEKLVGDPWLKCMIDLAQTEDVEEIELLNEIVNDEWFKVHLPQLDLEPLRAQWVHKIMAKEDREVRMGDMVSNQFTDEYSKQLGKQLTNAAERFETIYPRHRANDTVTFLMAVKKRLRFSNPAKEVAKLNQARMYGKYLLAEFRKKIPLKSHHDPVMLERALRAFEEKKTSKSIATIENHSERSCSDWLADVGMIFSKSQLCTKFDNRFRVAKAAQSIVCFQHAVLCRFAPYMRYIEMKVQEVLPPNMYIHSGKGLDELDAWVQKGSFSGVCTESDYEAFDASQDQYIMAFELEVMHYLGLPLSLINDYIYIKTHLGSKLGNFAIMRFSGEASTFLFNTMANMLFTFQRYELKGNEFICFAGDDMCASKHLSISRKHDDFLNKLKLKAKVQFTDRPTFCGWNLIPEGIYKKPQLVLERMCIAKETNNLHNCIDNYAIEVSFAYKLGEKAVNRMSEEEVEALYNCVRIIIKNKHLLKSKVVDLFTSLE